VTRQHGCWGSATRVGRSSSDGRLGLLWAWWRCLKLLLCGRADGQGSEGWRPRIGGRLEAVGASGARQTSRSRRSRWTFGRCRGGEAGARTSEPWRSRQNVTTTRPGIGAGHPNVTYVRFDAQARSAGPARPVTSVQLDSLRDASIDRRAQKAQTWAFPRPPSARARHPHPSRGRMPRHPGRHPRRVSRQSIPRAHRSTRVVSGGLRANAALIALRDRGAKRERPARRTGRQARSPARAR
jgi:hypothetical protein